MGAIVDPSAVLLELGLSASSTDEERAVIQLAIDRAEASVRRHLHYDPLKAERTEYYPLHSMDHLVQGSVMEVSATHAISRGLTGAGTGNLHLTHIPIRSVTSLRIDYDARSDTQAGAFGAETEKTEGTDFWANYDGLDDDGIKVCRDGILKSWGSWPTTPGTVKIVYEGGYTMEELHGQGTLLDASPITEVIIDEACKRVRRMMLHKKKTNLGFVAGPIVSERLGDYGYTVGSGGVDRAYGYSSEMSSESVQKLSTFVNWAVSLGG
jgi:hypothetical protein